jgi:hypothetical protein
MQRERVKAPMASARLPTAGRVPACLAVRGAAQLFGHAVHTVPVCRAGDCSAGMWVCAVSLGGLATLGLSQQAASWVDRMLLKENSLSGLSCHVLCFQ